MGETKMTDQNLPVDDEVVDMDELIETTEDEKIEDDPENFEPDTEIETNEE